MTVACREESSNCIIQEMRDCSNLEFRILSEEIWFYWVWCLNTCKMDISAGSKVDNKKADLQHFLHFKHVFPFPSRIFFFFAAYRWNPIGKMWYYICSISALKLRSFLFQKQPTGKNVITLQLHLQNCSIERYVPFSSRSSYNRENVSRKPAHLQGFSIETCGSIFFLKGLAAKMW